MQKSLIIFDLDGTLIDSSADLAAALNGMLQKLGREGFSQTQIDGWVGNGAQTLVKRSLLGKTDIADESIKSDLFSSALKIFLELYGKNVCVKTQLYPHVKELLEYLKSSGCTLVIVTNKPFAFVAPILQKLEIECYFDLVLGGDSLEEKKPSAMPLIYVCEYFDVEVDRALMIGDSKNDILAAKAAKMQSVGVSYGYNYGSSIEEFEPEYVVHSLDEIKEIVKNG